MNDDFILNSSEQDEDVPMKGKLTNPQKEALEQIFLLNLKYPKRWFTLYELDHVIYKTLDALVTKGYLHTKKSEANQKVVYWQYTGKTFDSSYVDELIKIHK